MCIRDRLDGLWSDEDFAEWYPRDGRPGLSPAQLATVCVLQFLLELSDRQAAEAVRCRIDFKYALAMELDDPGFHHSVLTDFRERLAEEGRADQLLSLALERIRAAGLVKERGRQRSDSTHVLAAVRDLTRIELVTEAMRAALENSPVRPRGNSRGWSRTTGASATDAQPGSGTIPPGRRPVSRASAMTPSCCWATSTTTCPACGKARNSRRYGRSSCRTTGSTAGTRSGGALPRRLACRPPPQPSSRPTT
ncbi:transposase [Streptomyces sp. WM6378]|uniref:transposase n=1 Tax=Streptomyces sp. WM6378 TaxID=1415557 RepID=UPI001F2E4BD2|nr:transposase [Streptomyces sp. WM6378]